MELMGASSTSIRFEGFTADARSGELYREGVKVKLQNQPFQVLLALLQHPGEVVTRQELRHRLWAHDTFVDFDRGLNKAINGLRFALRDRSAKPRLIETVPRRGYRFIGALLTSSVGHIRSLAILPLENLSGDPGEEYFCDGMTEELICAVAQIADLRVISRTSALSYKGMRKPLPEIARELRVDAIVEGTVARVGPKVRITAQLIYAPDDRHLWSGRYERDLTDILLLQSEIARGIAQEIHQFVDPAAARVRRVNPRAYEARLKGIYFRDKMTPADLCKSIEFFRRAIDLDPSDAQSHGDISQAFLYIGLFNAGQHDDGFDQAKAHAARALELDETVASAYSALAIDHVLRSWDWVRAEAESRRAVQLSPGQSITHVHLADYLSIQGRHEEAIAEFSRALELDPISRIYLGHSGLIFYRARRYEESISQCRKALEIDPGYANALWFLALSLEQQGKIAESIAALEQAARLSPASHYQALLGRAYALGGARQKAMEIRADLDAMAEDEYVPPIDFAIVDVGLGGRTSVFRSLNEAYHQKVFRIIEITLPMFDCLRDDSRWQDLVHKIGLA